MINFNAQFAATEQHAAESSGGIAALGLNVKSFVFQLITFVLVLLVLRKWVFPKLVETLEERRKVLEQSLEQAKETEKVLHESEAKAEEVLAAARVQADEALADAKKQAKEIVSEAEKSGEEAAGRIIKEAEEHLGQEREKLHSELRSELADLVVQTTEKVLDKRLTAKEDMELIKNSVKELDK